MTSLTCGFLRTIGLMELQLGPFLCSNQGSTNMTKNKSGTDDLTPPVNSDFSQPVIIRSANSCD